MSTPQGPNPPHGNPADPPAEEPAWGKQPPGGWGEPQPDPQSWDAEQTTALDPRAWGQQSGGQQGGGQASGGQQGRVPAQGQPYDQQQYGAPQYGPPQPTQQWPGPQQPGAQQQGWGQPGQQGWSPPAGQQPTQQWPGQPPGGPQQWGQGYPALPEPTPARTGRSRLPLILGGVVVLVIAAVAVLGFLWPGFFVTRVFDAAAVQAGVTKVLTESYGLQNVGPVTCGANIQVTQGASFTCEATIDGQSASVPIKVTSNDGKYEVGRPL